MRRTVSAAIDQEAAACELRGAALHLVRCSECRRFFVVIDAVSSVLRATELAPRNGSGPQLAAAASDGSHPVGGRSFMASQPEADVDAF